MILPKNNDGLPQISGEYSQPAAFMIETPGSFSTFFKNPSKAAWLILGLLIAVLVLLTGIVLGIRALFRTLFHHRKAQ